MFSDEDDGSGFTVGIPAPGAKLQSLFGGDQASKEGNESLMYTPQKQPKAKGDLQPQKQQKNDGKSSEGPSLMYACACHTYRFTNGQYTNQGKLGLAVLGSLATREYKLLVYASQKKAVTSAKITPSFALKVQKDNYASFYDDQSQNWSVRFDTEEQLFESVKRIAIARFNLAPNSVVSEELNVQSTQEVQKGDTVEVQYTCWLLEGNNVGKLFDSNDGSCKLLKFKVGKGKVIKGLDLGVVGMRKLSKRIIVVSAELANENKELGPKASPNTALLFHLEVTRVKFSSPQQDSDSVSLSGQMGSGASNSTDDLQEIGLPANTHELLTKTISDQLSAKPENTKSKLLERMSKMGQAMVLPPAPSSVVSVEDDMDEDDAQSVSSDSSAKPQIMPKRDLPAQIQQQPMANNVHVPQMFQQQQQPTVDPNFYAQQQLQQQQQQHQLALYQSPQSVQAAMFGYPSVPQMAAIPQQLATQPNAAAAPLSSTEMNLMLTDGRLKHTEIKADLNRIIDKVDSLSSKIGNLENSNKQLQTTSQSHQQIFSQAPEMEASTIMLNITRIIKENEKLKMECAEKTKKIEILNEKMTDLLTKNQSFFEKSNQLLANQTDSMQNSATQAMVKVSHLEDQNIRLQTELAALRSQLVQAHGQKDVISKNENHMTNRIDTLQQELMHAKESTETANIIVSEKDILIHSLQEKVKTGKTEQKQNQSKITQLQEEYSELKGEQDSLKKLLADAKKKRKSEKEKMDEEIEEIKTQHEEEMKNLRDRYKKSAGKESEKVEKVGEELRLQFDENMKSKLRQVEKSHSETLNTLQDENEQLKSELKKITQKLSNLSSEHSDSVTMEIEQVREEMKTEHALTVKKLNESITELQNQLETFETQQPSTQSSEGNSELLKKIDELKIEIEKLKSEFDRSYDKGLNDGRATLESISNASYERGKAEGKAEAEATKPSSAKNQGKAVTQETINVEIKKVMNSVFFKARSEFDPDEDYDGSTVVSILLDTIKAVTLSLLQQKDESSDEEGEEEANESEGEEKASSSKQNQTKQPASEAETNPPTTAEESFTAEKSSDKSDEIAYLHSSATSAENDLTVVTELPEVNNEPQEINVSLPEVNNEEASISSDVPEEFTYGLPEGDTKAKTDSDKEIDNKSSADSDDPLSAPVSRSSSLTDAAFDDPLMSAEGAAPESIEKEDPQTENEATVNEGSSDAIEKLSEPTTTDKISSATSQKESFGDTDDEDDYATDEGEDNSEPIAQTNELLSPVETKNELVNKLLDTIDDNQTNDKNHDDAKDDNSNLATTLENNDIEKSAAGPLLSDKLSGNNGNNEIDSGLSSESHVDPLSSSTETVDPLSSTIVNNEQPSELKPNDDTPLVSSENKRNALQDLGLDSSLFTGPPPQSPESPESLFGTSPEPPTADVAGNEEEDEVEVNTIGAAVTEPTKSAGGDAKKSASTTSNSIFDDDSDDDDLFSAPTSSHKVSPFVRSPPPLFADDDDDVNWI